MSAQYREDKKPIPTEYEKLSNTTKYKCAGCCSCNFGEKNETVNCNYLRGRSKYDQDMYKKWVK